MACLVWDSPGGREVFALDRAVLVVGRDPASDLRLPDATVSRRHALVQVDGERVRITDLGSTSKTRINGAALVRDVPSTLEAGDILHVGKLKLTLHLTPPPAPARKPARSKSKPAEAAAPPPTVRPRPKREQVAKPGGGGPWKVAAIGLAFVVVVLLGAFLALHGSEPETPIVLAEPPAPEQEPTPAPGDEADREPETPPEPRPDAEDPGDPDPEQAVDRAPAGSLPPAGYASVEACPDLLEVDGTTYFAVTVVSFDAGGVEARGRDGKVYTLARREVTRILDRADLVRRVAVQRAGFAPDDVASRLQLARWCAERYVPTEAVALLDEVLALEPGHEAARALRGRVEGER